MNRALILVHFDRDGLVDPYVIEAARAYRRVANQVVFVSTSTPEPPAGLEPFVDRYIHRENKGYDFGSWRAGLQSLGNLERFDEIIFVNDSVYGPLFDLEPALAEPRIVAADFWGMVLSEQTAAHVQSWFFAARSAVIGSPEFRRFWESAGEDLPKEEIIRRREIGLSVLLRRAGFRMEGVYDGRLRPHATRPEIRRHLSPWEPLRSYRHIRKTVPSRAPFNPAELFYDRLWQAGVPYIKRRLFHTNHYGLRLPLVDAAVRTRSPEWCPTICDHRRRGVDR